MKRSIFLCALFFLLIGGARAQKHDADFYKETYRKGFVTLKGDTLKYQKIFFDAFPSNFKAFKKLYGWNEQTGLGLPLTNEPPYYFSRFFEIKCISQKTLIKKIIDVSVNGVWIADAVALFQVSAFRYAVNNNKVFLSQLQLRSKADIISVWAFYLDYENQYYRKNAYETLLKATAPNNKSMAALVTAGYKKATARWKKH
ncbi:MAG: hypothetical protein V4553_19245 [Bacteroidota bacterium]